MTLNSNIIFSICKYSEWPELVSISQVSPIFSSLPYSDPLWMEKMRLDDMAPPKDEKADMRSYYETCRTNRESKLYLRDELIMAKVCSIVRMEGGIIASDGTNIYSLHSNTKSRLYHHDKRILSLAIDSVNLYFIDESYTIYSLVFGTHTAKKVGTTTKEVFQSRQIILQNSNTRGKVTLRFRSSVKLDNGEVIAANVYRIIAS